MGLLARWRARRVTPATVAPEPAQEWQGARWGWGQDAADPAADRPRDGRGLGTNYLVIDQFGAGGGGAGLG